MKKILHIIPSLRKGGAERMVLDICSQQSKLKNVKVKLVCFFKINSYEQQSKSIDLTVIPVDLKISIFRENLIKVDNLQKFIEKYNPCIIHTHLFYSELVTSFCNFPSAKWITHAHDNMKQFLKLSFKTFLKKNMITNYYERKILFKNYQRNGGTKIICISKNTFNFFNKNAPNIPKVLLWNAVDIERFSINKTKSKESSVLKLINVGTFVQKKNQIFLIEVARVLYDKNIDFRLTFLGEGPMLNKIKEKVEKQIFFSKIKFEGSVDNVENYLSKSDIYVHCATYEPFGLVLIEAMSMGLPVICLNGLGNNDLIEDGRNGFIVNSNNPYDFAVKLLQLYQDKKSLSKMSNYAKIFASRFDIKDYILELMKIYKA